MFDDAGEAGTDTASHVFVEGEPGGEVVLDGAVAHGAEHGAWAADEEFEVGDILLLHPGVEGVGDEALGAERAVVGGGAYVPAEGLELFDAEDIFGGATAEEGDAFAVEGAGF